MTPGEARTAEEVALDADVLDRVKRGIALLEEKHGKDWVDHIDLSVLDLASGSRCVLGQVYGGYGYGCRALGLDESGIVDDDLHPSEFGFDVSDETYDELDTAWTRAVEAERSARA